VPSVRCPTLITLFGTCALISGAGRTINDLWDRNLESAVGTLSDTYVPPSRRPHACRLTDVPTTQSASNVFPGPRRINTTGHHVYHAPIDGGAHRASTVVYIRPHSLTYCKNGTFYRLLTGSQLRKSSSLDGSLAECLRATYSILEQRLVVCLHGPYSILDERLAAL